jgi:hypothetical protein
VFLESIKRNLILGMKIANPVLYILPPVSDPGYSQQKPVQGRERAFSYGYIQAEKSFELADFLLNSKKERHRYSGSRNGAS